MLGVNPARVQERARFLDRVLLVVDPGDDVDFDAERRGAVPAGLAVAAPVGVAKIVRAVMRAVGEAALELLLLQDLAVVRDLLAGVFVLVNQAVAHTVGLVKPDRRGVVTDVPKGVDLLVLIVRHKADAAIEPRLAHLLFYVPSSEA